MGIFYDCYKKVKKEVMTSPRKCECCGCIETMDNLILKYDNGKFMCDDCAFIEYDDDYSDDVLSMEYKV